MAMSAREMLSGLPVRLANGGDARNATLLAAEQKYLANPDKFSGAELYNKMLANNVSVNDLLGAGVAQSTVDSIFKAPEAITDFQTPANLTSSLAGLDASASEAAINRATGLVDTLQASGGGIDAAERLRLQKAATEYGVTFADLQNAGINPNILFDISPVNTPKGPVFTGDGPMVYTPPSPEVKAPGIDQEFRDSAVRTRIEGQPEFDPLTGSPTGYRYTPAAQLTPATGSGMSWVPPTVTSRPRSLLDAGQYQQSYSQRFAEGRAGQDRELQRLFRETGAPQNSTLYNSWRNRLRAGEFGKDAIDTERLNTEFKAWAESLPKSGPAGSNTAGSNTAWSNTAWSNAGLSPEQQYMGSSPTRPRVPIDPITLGGANMFADGGAVKKTAGSVASATDPSTARLLAGEYDFPELAVIPPVLPTPPPRTLGPEYWENNPAPITRFYNWLTSGRSGPRKLRNPIWSEQAVIPVDDSMPNPEFVDRVNNPSEYPYIRNSDGSISTHRMAAEMDENGEWYVFPTIQMIGGQLKQFGDNRQAMESALKTGNYIKMSGKDEALRYAEGGYKRGTGLETFRPSMAESTAFADLKALDIASNEPVSRLGFPVNAIGDVAIDTLSGVLGPIAASAISLGEQAFTDNTVEEMAANNAAYNEALNYTPRTEEGQEFSDYAMGKLGEGMMAGINAYNENKDNLGPIPDMIDYGMEQYNKLDAATQFALINALTVGEVLPIGKGVSMAKKGITPSASAKMLDEVDAVNAPRADLDFSATVVSKMEEIATNPAVINDPVAMRFVQQIMDDPDAAFAQYAKIGETNGGKIINTDLVRELSADYRKDKTLAFNVHKGASAFSELLFNKRIAETMGEERAWIFTGGGPASGKTAGLSKEMERAADLVMDGTLAKFAKNDAMIERALESGKDIQIIYIDRDPLKALPLALMRAMESGRPVPLMEFARMHRDARSSIRQLHEKYKDNPKVDIQVVNNQGKLGEQFETTIDDISEMDYNETLTEGFKMLEEARLRPVKIGDINGGISEAIYQGTKGAYDPGAAQSQTRKISQDATQGDQGYRQGVSRQQTGVNAEGIASLPVKKKSDNLVLPPLENAQKTQLGASTIPSYEKAKKVLGGEKILDFGAGRGQGAGVIGADTYEPYPREGFNPTYSNPADIPDASYKGVTSLNVLNVVPREVRDEIVTNIGRVMEPGGQAVITTRGRDVLSAKGEAGPEPMSRITTLGTYQKGFTQPELREYISETLGSNYTVENLPEKIGAAGVLVKRTDTPAYPKPNPIEPARIRELSADTQTLIDEGRGSTGAGKIRAVVAGSSDIEFASEVLGEALTGNNLNPASDAVTRKTLAEIKEVTQESLKDMPDEVTVYRYGGIDAGGNSGSNIKSFTLNPNYSGPLFSSKDKFNFDAYTVNKKDIEYARNAFFPRADEAEVLIRNDKVRPTSVAQQTDVAVTLSDDGKGKATILRGGVDVGEISYVQDGNNIQIKRSDVTPQREGIGLEAYKQFIDSKLDTGMRVGSDAILSPEAQGLYRKLAKEGYVLDEMPNTRQIYGDKKTSLTQEDMSAQRMAMTTRYDTEARARVTEPGQPFGGEPVYNIRKPQPSLQNNQKANGGLVERVYNDNRKYL